jgi:D-sedoheptulose 7-phosphate isomerase
MTAHAVDLALQVTEREQALEAFLEAEQHRIAYACLDMARAFARGGTLIVYGTGPAATDAAHVAVEFMHPVIVGKRALPAIAPTNDPSRAGSIEVLGRPGDIALGIAHAPGDAKVERFLASAQRQGMLTIALGADRIDADHALVATHDDARIVQELQETAYHVLWELVHVFFEHPGLLEETCVTCGDVAVEVDVIAVVGATAVVDVDGSRERVAIELVDDVRAGDRLLVHAGVALEKLEPTAATDFLYPFLESREDDVEAVLADVRASTIRKGADAIALRRGIDLDTVAVAGAAVRDALQAGGRLLAFGNGGSATDAQDVVADALGLGWPAVALPNDASTVTGISNDVGFENAFARQLIALGRPGDVAIAISTSGSSPNIVAALEEANRREMLSVAIAGYGGGRLRAGTADHLIAVSGDYVPRIQEAHATVYHLLLEVVGPR